MKITRNWTNKDFRLLTVFVIHALITALLNWGISIQEWNSDGANKVLMSELPHSEHSVSAEEMHRRQLNIDQMIIEGNVDRKHPPFLFLFVRFVWGAALGVLWFRATQKKDNWITLPVAISVCSLGFLCNIYTLIDFFLSL